MEHHLLAAVILSDSGSVRMPHQSSASLVAQHQGEAGLGIQVTECTAPTKLEVKKTQTNIQSRRICEYFCKQEHQDTACYTMAIRKQAMCFRQLKNE